MKLRYRGRSSGSQQDHDLYGVLTLDVGDVQTDRVTGHFMGRAAVDLDGVPTRLDENVFFSLEDTGGSGVDSTLYYLYADVHDVGPLETVRLGRQTLYETPAFAWFDGLLLETSGAAQSDLQAGLYGGVPVRQYGLFPADLILGAYLNAWPWEGGRARFDWMHVDDELALSINDDDLFGLGLWQTLGEAWRVEGQYSVLNAEHRDVRLAAHWYEAERDVSVNATYYQLLTPQRDLALEFDPLFPTLFEYFPFFQASLLATKGFGESLRLEGGLDFRRVSDGEDVGVLNRDYDRGHLTAIFPTWLPGDVALSLTGDVWDATASEVRSWGVDLTGAVDERAQWSVGSYFSLFKYDVFRDSEQTDVRTFYVRARTEASRGLRVQLSYEFNDDDTLSFHTFLASLTWRF